MSIMSVDLGDSYSNASESILDSCTQVVTAPSTPRPKAQLKLSDKIKHVLEQDYPSYSFEYFPPKNKQGLFNLTERIRRMGTTQPLWVDITHSKHAKTLELAELLLEYTTVDIMVHLSMTNMRKEDLREFLNQCKDIGIRNILAIRGDPPRGYDSWIAMDSDLQHCCDLVSFIRSEYGNYFSIFVGGYPEGHHNAEDLETDISYLKKKVDSGANAIITQLFYDTDKFFKFVTKCRLSGINVPIIPGLMPIQTYQTFVRIVSFTNATIPSSIWSELEPIKHNDEKVKQYGIKLMYKICKEILDYGINTLHFYTFNLERSVTKITNKLNLYYNDTVITKSKSYSNLRSLHNEVDKKSDFPWDNSKGGYLRRKQETVRPIFWSNRQESYLNRTAHWDEFPNGRWGDYRSPAYGEFLDHHFLRQTKLTVNYRLLIWGKELNKFTDIYNVFINYLNNKIDQLPWCNQQIGEETLTFLLEPLKLLNSYGFLSINSQPQVNGAPSNDPIVGWGNNNGYIYQKAYLEFFCSKENTEKLLKILEEETQNGNNSLSYQAINMNGKLLTNVYNEKVNAVTWGVFSNCEILQPTIVDQQSFIAWKDEAFSLWINMWQSIYEKNTKSYDLIQNINNDWYLINIVENDYINGNIFKPFIKLFKNDKNYKHIENVFNLSIKSQSKILSSSLSSSSWKKYNNNNQLTQITECNDESKTNQNEQENYLKQLKNPYLDEKLLLPDITHIDID